MQTRERFESPFSVAPYEADFTGHISIYSLFQRFQDLAGRHAAFLQVGYGELHASNLAWVLSRIRADIRRWPAMDEPVVLATWPKGVDRLFAMRDFALTGKDGELLAVATSAWLLIDVEKKRPQRIESLPADLRFPGAPHAIAETPDKLPMPDPALPVFDVPVRLSDIDINRHVNNAVYAKWIGDCFSAEQFSTRRIASVQINFLEETLPGDTVGLAISSRTETEKQYLVTGLSRTKHVPVFQSRVTWA